jgi:hypothetical protein
MRFLIPLLFIFSGLLLTNSCSRNKQLVSANDSIDFNLHIRPILSDRCFKCHGPDANQRKSNLRLDTREGALAALKNNPNGHVIIPGNPDQSEMYLRISASDTSFRMPPPNSNLSLTKDEISTIWGIIYMMEK